MYNYIQKCLRSFKLWNILYKNVYEVFNVSELYAAFKKFYFI